MTSIGAAVHEAMAKRGFYPVGGPAGLDQDAYVQAFASGDRRRADGTPARAEVVISGLEMLQHSSPLALGGLIEARVSSAIESYRSQVGK